MYLDMKRELRYINKSDSCSMIITILDTSSNIKLHDIIPVIVNGYKISEAICVKQGLLSCDIRIYLDSVYDGYVPTFDVLYSNLEIDYIVSDYRKIPNFLDYIGIKYIKKFIHIKKGVI